mgnify:CR=1 FL=1
MKKNKQSEQQYSPKFELVLQVRNHGGECTGKTVSYSTDNEAQLDDFYQRNCYREKKVNDKTDAGRPKNRRPNSKNSEATKNN